MTIRPLHAALLAAALACTGTAHALVESGHWSAAFYTDDYPPGTNFSVSFDQTRGGDTTGVSMRYDNGLLTGVTYAIDEGSDLFIVQPGTEFSMASVAAGGQPLVYGTSVRGNNWPGATLLPVGTDFYLGARTRSYSDPGFSYGTDFFTVFGWAHVVVDAQGVPRIVDSAMAFREGGIVVGTLDAIPAVPEPATWLMMGLGLAGLAAARRVSRH